MRSAESLAVVGRRNQNASSELDEVNRYLRSGLRSINRVFDRFLATPQLGAHPATNPGPYPVSTLVPHPHAELRVEC